MARETGKHRLHCRGVPFSRTRRDWKAGVRAKREQARAHLLAHPPDRASSRVGTTRQIPAAGGSTSSGPGGQLAEPVLGAAARTWTAHTICYPIFGAVADASRAWARLVSGAAWGAAAATTPGGPAVPTVTAVAATSRSSICDLPPGAGAVRAAGTGTVGRYVRSAGGYAELGTEGSARFCRAAANSLRQAAYSSRTSPAIPGGRVGVGLMVPPEMAHGYGNQLREDKFSMGSQWVIRPVGSLRPDISDRLVR